MFNTNPPSLPFPLSAACAPQDVNVISECTDASMVVSWSPNPDAQGFQVTAVSNTGARHHCNSSGTACTIENLTCGQNYSVTVVSVRDGCESEPSTKVETCSGNDSLLNFFSHAKLNTAFANGLSALQPFYLHVIMFYPSQLHVCPQMPMAIWTVCPTLPGWPGMPQMERSVTLSWPRKLEAIIPAVVAPPPPAVYLIWNVGQSTSSMLPLSTNSVTVITTTALRLKQVLNQLIVLKH